MLHRTKDCYLHGYGWIIMQLIVTAHVNCVIEILLLLKKHCGFVTTNFISTKIKIHFKVNMNVKGRYCSSFDDFWMLIHLTLNVKISMFPEFWKTRWDSSDIRPPPKYNVQQRSTFRGDSELFPVWRHSFRDLARQWHLAGNSFIVRCHATMN